MFGRRPSTAEGRAEPLGVTIAEGGVNVAVTSCNADQIWLCLFDRHGHTEKARLPLKRVNDDTFASFVAHVGAGSRYGLRADGPFDPARGHRFDASKLLVDPYARRLDRPFVYDDALAAPREAGRDTASLVPKAIVQPAAARHPPLPPQSPGIIYEIGVKAFSQANPVIDRRLRGTVAALRHPASIDHLHRLGIDTVELMPIAAWIDERHLAHLGLANAWGYNPVTFMAPDPRLAPGGLAEIADTVTALHEAGIRVILDVVYNHTGESDAEGPTLSLRGLDNALYFLHDDAGTPVNDTGTGNTLAANRPQVVRLIVDAMRNWAEATGIDGFRVDLATVLGRTLQGFRPDAPLLRAIAADPILARLTLVAEPWDIGPGGYQLGNFPRPWLEWNDRFRDDVRRFWRGDAGSLGALATRLAGSADVFEGDRAGETRSINFVAAHDGFALADVVAYADKHNEANGEGNRDGSSANFSWNNGVEGPSRDDAVNAARRADIKALLATMLFSRGTPMLTAGDEFGRTQGGNNNAYAQDNAATWLDWSAIDHGLLDFAASAIALRKAHPAFASAHLLKGMREDGAADVLWLNPAGGEMQSADWTDDARVIGLVLQTDDDRVALWINGSATDVEAWLPETEGGRGWQMALATSGAHSPADTLLAQSERYVIPPRSLVAFVEAN